MPVQVPLQVVQPPNSWTAVVRGAVLRGLEGLEMVISRKSRHHYGVRVRQPWDKWQHPEDCKVWCKVDACWKAKDRMTWYVKKGSEVSSQSPLSFPFYHDFAIGGSKTCTQKLIVCDTDFALDGFGSSPGAATRVMHEMFVDLENVPARLWQSRTGANGRKYQRLQYDLGMEYGSGGLEFDMRVRWRGLRQHHR